MPLLTKKIPLEQVIHQALTDRVKKEPCTGVTLMHVDGVGSRSEVYTMQIAPGAMDAADIAETMESRAEVYCSGSTDKKKFELGFFYGNEKPLRPYVFWVTSATALSEHGVEEATAKGLVKSVMSAANEIQRINFEQINANGQAMIEMVEAVTAHAKVVNEQLKEVREERDALVDHLMSMRFQGQSKEHEYRMQELEKQKKNEMFHQVMTLLPGLANQILKKNVFPESTGDTALLKGLGASLMQMDPKVVLGVFSQLPETVGGPLMSRFMQLKEEEDARVKAQQEALALAAGAVKAPELDAAPAANPSRPQGGSESTRASEHASTPTSAHAPEPAPVPALKSGPARRKK